MTSYEPVYPGGWRDKPDTSTPIDAAALDHLEAGIEAALAAALAAAPMTTSAVRSAAYTSVGNEIVPADATSAGFTVKLPNGPLDATRVIVKKIDASANAVAVQCQGSAVLNKSGGSTSVSLTLTNQAVFLQYKAAGAIWYIVSDDLPLASLRANLDGVYSPLPVTSATTLNQLLGHDGGQANGVRWFTTHESTARAVGYVIVTDPQWAGGADPTGATDSTAAIQAAIDTGASAGKTRVWFPPGTYLHNGLTISHSGTVLQGAGPFRSILRCNHATNDMITATSLSVIGVRDLELGSTSSSRTAGLCFNFSGLNQYQIDNVRCSSGPQVGKFVTCQLGYFRKVDCVPSATPLVGDQWYFQKCTSTFIDQVSCNIGSNVLDSSSAQFHFDSGNDTIRMSSLCAQASTSGGGRGVWFTNSLLGSGDPLGFASRWVRMISCYLEAATGLAQGDANRLPGMQIDDVLDLRMNDSYSFSSKQGVQINGGTGIWINGLSAANNSEEAVRVNGGTLIFISRLLSSDNSQAAHNTYSGVYIGAIGGSVDVTESTFTDAYRGFTNKQKYGIENYGTATTTRSNKFTNMGTSPQGGTATQATFRGVAGTNLLEFTGAEQYKVNAPTVWSYANGANRDAYWMLGNAAGSYRFWNVGASIELARLEQDGGFGLFDVGSPPAAASGRAKFFSQGGVPKVITGGGTVVDLTAASGSASDPNLLVARSFDPVLATTTTTILTSGTGVWVKLPVGKASVITNLLMYVSTAGATLTTGQCFIALYDSTGAQIGVTGDMSTVWNSIGVKTMPLGTPTAARTVGEFIYAVIVSNGTTNPVFRGASSPLNNVGLTAAAGLRYGTYSTGLTAAPGSVTISSAVATSTYEPWLGAN